jgi:hypothetical protein
MRYGSAARVGSLPRQSTNLLPMWAFPNTPTGAASCLGSEPVEPGVRTDITKEEAARRQLETSIALIFCENDDISIHVLASSAAQTLTDNLTSWRDLFIR